MDLSRKAAAADHAVAELSTNLVEAKKNTDLAESLLEKELERAEQRNKAIGPITAQLSILKSANADKQKENEKLRDLCLNLQKEIETQAVERARELEQLKEELRAAEAEALAAIKAKEETEVLRAAEAEALRAAEADALAIKAKEEAEQREKHHKPKSQGIEEEIVEERQRVPQEPEETARPVTSTEDPDLAPPSTEWEEFTARPRSRTFTLQRVHPLFFSIMLLTLPSLLQEETYVLDPNGDFLKMF